MVSLSGQPCPFPEYSFNKSSQLSAVVTSQKSAVAYYLLPAPFTKCRGAREQGSKQAKENLYKISTQHLVTPILQINPLFSKARGLGLFVAYCQPQADVG